MGALDTLVRSAVYPRISYRGSLDYIDRLPTRRPISITHGILGRTRDAFVISNAVTYLSRAREQRQRIGAAHSSYATAVSPNISDFRVLGDGRTWHPMGDARPLASTNRIASTLKPYWDKPEDPFEVQKRFTRPSPFSHVMQDRAERLAILGFSWPKRLVICAKRQIRREVLAAMNVLGSPGLRPPLMRPMSQIRC